MRRPKKRTVAVFGAATIGVLMWPGPASGQTSLGGYSGLAVAQAVRIQVYEPTIPIPATPQIDGGFAYTRANTDTGPVSRGLASYLWPGDVIGDGFGALAGNDSAKYPVQVNSRTPATSTAPTKNQAQLTDGNGMATTSNADATTATVTGLGVAGPNTDLTGGLGSGLSQLGGQAPASNAPAPPSAPVPVSKTLAGLATVAGVKSESDVLLAKDTITSTARAYASDTELLGGLIKISHIDMTSSTVSDGKTATTTGHATVSGVSIAGQQLTLDERGFNLAGHAAKPPAQPQALTDGLAKIGLSVEYLKTVKTASGASGSLSAQGMIISVDTAPLKNALNTGAITGPIGDAISKIPQLGSQIGPLLNLGPKIVYIIGDVETSSTGAPAYTGGTTTGTGSTGGTTSGSGTSSGGGVGGSTGGSTGGGSLGGGTGGTTGGGLPAGGTTGGGTGTGATTAVQPAAFSLPALGAVPKLLILGGLALAIALGWALRTAGGVLLGTSRNCVFGLSNGVPDLRKG